MAHAPARERYLRNRAQMGQQFRRHLEFVNSVLEREVGFTGRRLRHRIEEAVDQRGQDVAMKPLEPKRSVVVYMVTHQLAAGPYDLTPGPFPKGKGSKVKSGARSGALHSACEWPLRRAASSCSNPPVSIAQFIPHSLGAPVSHHHRPERASSPAPVARVHGAHPMDV